MPACSTQLRTAEIIGSLPIGSKALHRLSLPVSGKSLSRCDVRFMTERRRAGSATPFD